MVSGKVEGPALTTLQLKPFPLLRAKAVISQGIEHPFALTEGFKAQQS